MAATSCLSQVRKACTLGRSLPFPWADEVIGAARAQGERERHDEPPRAQLVIGQHVMHQQHSGALDRGVECVVGAVEAQPRLTSTPSTPAASSHSTQLGIAT